MYLWSSAHFPNLGQASQGIRPLPSCSFWFNLSVFLLQPFCWSFSFKCLVFCLNVVLLHHFVLMPSSTFSSLFCYHWSHNSPHNFNLIFFHQHSFLSLVVSQSSQIVTIARRPPHPLFLFGFLAIKLDWLRLLWILNVCSERIENLKSILNFQWVTH